MVNKSGYPLSAVNAVIRTEELRDVAFITSADRESLNEIYRYNPLRFNIVPKLAGALRNLTSDPPRGCTHHRFYSTDHC